MVTRADKYTAVQKQKELYSDVTANFDPHPHNNQLVRKTNEEAIIRAVRNLVLTGKFERLKQPEIGSRLRSLLFELITPASSLALKSEIERTLDQEPRINVVDVIVVPHATQHYYQITIIFTVINRAEPVEISIALNRIR